MRRGKPRAAQMLGGAAAACLLLAAGLMAWRTEEVRPPVVHEPPDSEADAAPAPASHLSTQNSSAGSTEMRRAIADESAAPRTVAVRFRQRLQRSSPYFTGTVTVLTNGVDARLLAVINREAVTMELPAGTRRVRFSAVGFRPVEWDVVSPLPEIVTFVPDAGVQLNVSGTSESEVAVRWEMHSGPHCHAEWRFAPGGIASPRKLAVPSGRPFSWRAILDLDGAVTVVSGQEEPLQSGECRTVSIDAQSVTTKRFRIVGVSTSLLPHLTLRMHAKRLAGYWGQASRVRLDAEGRFAISGDDPVRFRFDLAGGEDSLVEEPTGEECLLRPRAPLIGFCRSDATGELVEFSLRQEDRRSSGRAKAEVFAFERAALAQRLIVKLPGEVAYAISTEHLPVGVDFVDLAHLPSEALAELVVQFSGEKPARVTAGPVRLELVRPDGSVAATTDSGRFRPVDAGTYDLRWNWAGRPGDWLVRDVVLAAGMRKELDAEWPAPAQWTGEVLGHSDTPADHRFVLVRFGEWPHLHGGVHLAIDADGRFALSLPEGTSPAPLAEFRWGAMRVRGEVVAVDAERAHIVVRPPSGLRWITLRVEGQPAGWTAMLHRNGVDMPWAVVWSHEQRPIVVPPGVVLGGSLYDTRGFGANGDAPLAWFEVDGTRDEVTLRASATRSLEVRQASPRQGRWIALVGPRGQMDAGQELPETGSVHLTVPFDTRGVMVFDGNTDGARRRELPLSPGPVVVIH